MNIQQTSIIKLNKTGNRGFQIILHISIYWSMQNFIREKTQHMWKQYQVKKWSSQKPINTIP